MGRKTGGSGRAEGGRKRDGGGGCEKERKGVVGGGRKSRGKEKEEGTKPGREGQEGADKRYRVTQSRFKSAHYGSEQHDAVTSNHTLSYELRMNDAERASKASRVQQAND